MMNTTQDAGQHMVLFVAAGDGSAAACEAVAQRLSEKFGMPYEKMLASIRQSPRVFKRNLNQEQAESYAAMLRSMGAVAEVKNNGTAGEQKPPPPEVTDRTCPFCGRALQADGVCVICKPREVAPRAAEMPRENEPDPVIDEPAIESEPAVETAPPLTVQTWSVEQDQPPSDPVLDPGQEDQDSAPPPEPEQAMAPSSGWAAAAPAAGIGPAVAPDSQRPPLEAGCANCGGLLGRDGQCPACDLGTAVPLDESAAIENDLSALLAPEELGVCPNCCGPMEHDGTCLICPPADPAEQQPFGMTEAPAAASASETAGPFSAAPEAFGEFPLDGPLTGAAPLSGEDMMDTVAAMSAPAVGHATSRFEPLASLQAEPEDEVENVCRKCGGPQGTDGICLICGGDTAAALPAFEDMQVTGNEPPPAQPVAPGETPAPAMAAETPLSAAAAESHYGNSSTGKSGKPTVHLDLSRFPRALTIPLLAALLLIGGITLAMGGSFIIASGIWFLALIAGLVAVFSGIKHLEQTVGSFPRLPKPVTFAFLLFLFLAGSGAIIGYAFKQSALYLLDKAGAELQAEFDRLPGEGGLPNGTDAEPAGDPGSQEEGRQIILEEEMLQRAIATETAGEDNPRAALENWSAYLEAFPDGSSAPEARRKVSHWQAVVKREDALAAVIARDRKGNNDPTARIRDWKSCIATYGNTPSIRAHAEDRIGFWESMLQQSAAPNFPYWASVRLDDGRTFSGKVVAENDQEMKMELTNRLKMKFKKGEFELIDSDHINGKRVEGENMRLVSGVTTERPTWGQEDGITIIGEDRAGVEAMVAFRVSGFYHLEVLARATKDHGGYPSAILSLDGTQQERIRFDSEEWKLYKVAFPFRIPAGERRLEIVFPPQYQTMQDQRIVAIDYLTTAMVE
jgi:hypothetical protein